MAVTSDSLDFTFLDAVNRVLRTSTLIRGDDDNVTSFTDTQHSANLQLAMIAIQDQISDLASDSMLDLELAEGTLATSAGQRVYNLANDFVRFEGDAYFYKASQNYLIAQYPGGRRQLKSEIYDYKTQSGDPNWWYWEPSSRKKVGFYQVPDAVYNYTYDYQRSVYVSTETDEMPFHTNEEVDAFCQMATRRFKFSFERSDNAQMRLESDVLYQSAKTRLYNLMRPTTPRLNYGRIYR